MFILTKYFIDKIENYPRVTLEDSLKKVMKSKNKMIGGRYSPKVFDMEFEEVEYISEGLKLYGWYIPVEGATKTIVISHGRNNNRIFSLTYLQLFLDMELKDKYNIFLPDLRNSGKSDISRTAFGYYFSFDIKNALIFLKEKYRIDNYVLYGFSQSGMATALVPYLHGSELEMKKINVEKLILDSPVSNVEEIILENALIFGYKIPYAIMAYILNVFNGRIDKNLENLKLSKILGIKPTIILQSEKDSATPYNMLNHEYNILKEREKFEEKFIKPIFKVFRQGQHVRIYLRYKWEYTKNIENFLNLS